MLRLLDPATFRTVPWKNGGGTATDIAVGYGGDGEVDWRVGTAAIDRDGPFSDYDGVTRTFTIVRGAGVHLDFPGQGTRLVAPDAPTVFAGAPAPYCRLVDGVPATAFNLLTRDVAASGTVTLVAGGLPRDIAAADILVLYAITGSWRLTTPTGQLALPPGAAVTGEGAGALMAEGPIGARLAAVAITTG